MSSALVLSVRPAATLAKVRTPSQTEGPLVGEIYGELKVTKKQMAWTPSLWAAIGREMDSPSVPLIIDECRVLYKAVFPHRMSAELAVATGGGAYWKNVSSEAALRWGIAMTGWGCNSERQGSMGWTEDTGVLVTRVGLWVWSRAFDGPLPTVLAASSTHRRNLLLKEQDALELHPIWEGYTTETTTRDERRVLTESIPTRTARETQVLQMWSRMYDELKWKSDTVPKLAKWFEKRPVVPPHTRQLWLDAWMGPGSQIQK